MSTLINASIKTSELKKIDQNKIIKGEKDSYIPITISVNDESRYGKNVSITIAQDQDERASNKPKHYLGNGSAKTLETIWFVQLFSKILKPL